MKSIDKKFFGVPIFILHFLINLIYIKPILILGFEPTNEIPERHCHSFGDRRHKVAAFQNDGDTTVCQRHQRAAIC